MWVCSYALPAYDWQRTCLDSRRSVRPSRLVLGDGDRFRGLLVVLRSKLRRPEAIGQLVDRAVEGKRHLIVVVVHSGAEINADVEGLVSHFQEGDRVWLLPCGNYLSVHLQYTAAALGDARTVIGVVEHDRVLARGKRLLAYPAVLGEGEHVVIEHRLALEQVQPNPAKATAIGDDHPVATTGWHSDVCGNHVRLAQEVWCIAGWNARQDTRVGEHCLSRSRARPRCECPRKRIVVQREHVVLFCLFHKQLLHLL